MFGQQALEDSFNAGADGAMLSEVTGFDWAEYAFKHDLPPQHPSMETK